MIYSKFGISGGIPANYKAALPHTFQKAFSFLQAIVVFRY